MMTTERKLFTADPSALGLLGLALVTLVASTQKLGWTSGTSLIIPWAIFLGAGAQLYACFNDAKKGNVFGATAFGGYGLFWLGVSMTWLIQHGVFGEKIAAAADPAQLGVAFVGYLIFTLFMTVAATRTTKVLLLIFILIDFLFAGLALTTLCGLHIGSVIAGWSELLIALASFYAAAANVLNHTFGYPLLPVGQPLKLFVRQ